MVHRFGFYRQMLRLASTAAFVSGWICGCETQGFEQLADTAPRNVYFPGKALGSVGIDETPIELLGENGSPSAVVTRDLRDTLRIYGFDGKTRCTVGKAAPLDDPLGPSTYEAVDRYLPFQVRIDPSLSELHVVDDRCKERLGPYKNGRGIGRASSYLPTSIVVLTEEHRLIKLDPARGAETVIAEWVHDAVQTAQYLYTLEHGTVTVRDRKLEVVAEVGDGVISMRVDGANERVAYVDKRGLYVLPKVTDKEQFVEKRACNVEWMDAPAALVALEYTMSCDGGEWIANLSAVKKRKVLPSYAKRPLSIRDFSTKDAPNWVISFFSGLESEGSEPRSVREANGNVFQVYRRYIGRFDEPAFEVGHARTYRSVSAVSGGKVLLWLDPETEKSRLIAWSPSEQSEVLSDVKDFSPSPSPMRAVVERQGRRSLYVVSTSSHPQRLVDDVAYETSRGSKGVLIGTSVSNDVGKVNYLEAGGDSVEPLFSAAYVPSAHFIWDGVAVSALERYSLTARRGELCVRLIVSADTFCEPDVTSYLPTYRPALGMAYVTRRGEKFALHWAEAR